MAAAPRRRPDLAFKPAHEIAEAVRNRTLSPVETVEAALAATRMALAGIH